MRLFNPDNHTLTKRHKELYALFTIAYTIVDFIAALMFVIGSILFFNEDTTYVGTWLFLIGSVFFGLRPTITLMREIAYLRASDYDDLIAD
jgi:hypothetical protein